MIHLLSALIVGAVYGGAYSAGGRSVPVYRFSVILLLVFFAVVSGSIIWETELLALLGENSWATLDYGRNVLGHSLWLQSLICAVLSIFAMTSGRNWKYLAGACVSGVLFIVLAIMGGGEALAAVLR